MKRVGDRFVEIGWSEALELAAEGLRRVQARHGADSVATYLGNPSAHSSAALAGGLVRRVLRIRNNYSATSTDQLPQYVSSHEMFGHFALLPIPDIDRTDYMLVMGANPAVSNGSVMTAPGMRHRLTAIRERGGKVVVVDPRRTETVKARLRAVAVGRAAIRTCCWGCSTRCSRTEPCGSGASPAACDGVLELASLAAEWGPDRAARNAGVDAQTIVRLAREFASAPSAVAYGRVGVCQQETGSVTHWLINALNALTGNLDRPGGAMFTTPAVDVVSIGELVLGRSQIGRYRQRVSGLPAFMDELPVAGLADEILTPGAGQVRGMLLYAGNPVLSTPGGARSIKRWRSSSGVSRSTCTSTRRPGMRT